jgi:hypothetical protein
MPVHIGSFVNDQIANLGSRYEQFSVSPAAMLIRVSANHLGKPDVVISAECPAEETVNRIVVGFKLLDELALFLRLASRPRFVSNGGYQAKRCCLTPGA